jgi:hypothetical protein
MTPRLLGSIAAMRCESRIRFSRTSIQSLMNRHRESNLRERMTNRSCLSRCRTGIRFHQTARSIVLVRLMGTLGARHTWNLSRIGGRTTSTTRRTIAGLTVRRIAFGHQRKRPALAISSRSNAGKYFSQSLTMGDGKRCHRAGGSKMLVSRPASVPGSVLQSGRSDTTNQTNQFGNSTRTDAADATPRQRAGRRYRLTTSFLRQNLTLTG